MCLKPIASSIGRLGCKRGNLGRPVSPERGTYLLRVRSYGWPFACLSIAVKVDSDTDRAHHNGLLIRNAGGMYAGIETPWQERFRSPMGDPKYRDPTYWRLPIVPFVPGFLADVLFYAWTSWLILFGPFTVRGQLRRRHGRCVRCGYDLAGLEACPECGE